MPSNLSVSHSKIIVAGGDRIREDNGLTVDPKTNKKGIKATFQEATDEFLLYTPSVEIIEFEQLFLEDNHELDDITSRLVQYRNLELIHTQATVNKKKKINNPTMKKLIDFLDSDNRLTKIDEKMSSISPNQPFYQSSGNQVKSKEIKSSLYTFDQKLTNKPVQDRCCDND